MRSHRDAHDNVDDNAGPPPVLDHPDVSRHEPHVITKQGELLDLIERLRARESFGYDSEFIGEESYYPRLCLIQTAMTDEVSLIDPLADLDLAPLWALLADPAVEKIVHAGTQDLEPVARHLQQPPQNIFDTQIAAAFIGMHYPSNLTALANELIGADLGHGLTFSQWDHRPLTPIQVQYAANDVRYLPLLRRAFAERLNESGNAAWAAEECHVLTHMEHYHPGPRSSRVRLRGADRMGERQRAVLHALLVWREEEAERRDLPSRVLAEDHVLRAMAEKPPEDLDSLRRMRGLPRPTKSRYGETLLDVIQQARSGPIPPAARYVGPPENLRELRARTDDLWKCIERQCSERGIHPAIVSSKKELLRLLRQIDEAEIPERITRLLNRSRLTQGWRRQLLGPFPLEKILPAKGDS